MFERLLCKARPRAPLQSAQVRKLPGIVPAIGGMITISLATSLTAQQVQVSGLTNINFGMINNLSVDAVNSQGICVFASGNPRDYSISATGSGAGGAFALANGPNQLAYQVRWNQQPGQTNGTMLSPGTPLTGQITTSQNKDCTNGPPATASLIIVLPAASLSSAIEGTYSGTLTLIVAAE